MMPVKKETVSSAVRRSPEGFSWERGAFSPAAGAAGQVFSAIWKHDEAPRRVGPRGPTNFAAGGFPPAAKGRVFQARTPPPPEPAPAGFSEKSEFGSRKERTVMKITGSFIDSFVS